MRDFRWRVGIRSTPELLFRLRFFIWFGRSVSFPSTSISFGEGVDEESPSIAFEQIAYKRIQCLGHLGHPAHIVESSDLQSGIMQRACRFICDPPF